MLSVNKYIKSGFLYFAAAFFGPLVAIAVNPLLAENLSHEDYAIIGYFTSFQSLLLPLVGLNLTTYFIRNYFSTAECARPRFVDTLLIGQVFVGGVAVVVFSSLFYLYFKSSDKSFGFSPYFFYAFAQIYLSVFGAFYLTKLRIERKAGAYALVSLGSSLLSIALTLLCVVGLKQGAEGKLFSAFCAAMIFAGFSFWKSVSRLQFDWGFFAAGLKFGFPLTVSALFWYFLTGVDKALLERLNDTHVFGTYIVAAQIAGYMAIFYTAINSVLEADIFKAISDKNGGKAKRLILVMFCVVAGANFFYILVAPQVVGLLTADRYLESVKYSQIFALQNIAMAAYYLAIKLFVGYGYLIEELAVRVVGAGISFCVFYYLIERFGFDGAAWGQVFSFSVMAFLSVLIFYLKVRENDAR